MNKARRYALLKARRNLVIEYHRLGDILTGDDPLCTGKPEGEIDVAFERVSEAIDCINRETGRPEGS